MKLFNTKVTASMIFPPIFLVIVFISMWVSLSYIETESKKNIHKSLNAVLHTTQEALQLWLGGRLEELADVVNDKEVIGLTQALLLEYEQQKTGQPADIPEDNNATLKKLRALMDGKMQRHDDKGFFIIAPDRISIASMRDSNIGTENLINRARKAYLDRAFDGGKLFIPSINSDVPLVSPDGVLRDKQPTIFIAAPVKDSTSKVIAVLTLRLDPMTHFTRITQLGAIGNTGESYAFDKKGLLITKSRFNDHLRSIGTIGDDEFGMLSIRVTDPGGNLLEGYVPTVALEDRPLTLMAQRAISGNLEPHKESYRDYRGVTVFGAWLWNKSLGIGLATEMDAKEVLQPYELTRIVITTVLGIIVLLIIALVFFPLWLQEREKEALKKHRDSLEKTVRKRTAQLEEANRNLKILSEIDPLTEIANRRLYEQTLTSAIAASKRASQAMSLMIIDIDFFKPFNDNYGHDKGDVILKNIAQVIAGSLTRTTDFAARYGGEEFVVLMPLTDAEGAQHFAKVIKENIETKAFEHRFSKVADIVTVSIGVSSLIGETLNQTDLFKQADSALYQAKENGRNRIVLYDRYNLLSAT